MLRPSASAVLLACLCCRPSLAQTSAADPPAGYADPVPGHGATISAPAHEAEAAAVRGPRSWILLPHLFYSPETGLAGGAVAGYYPGGGLAARPSTVLSSFTLTAHRQAMAEVTPELYLRDGRLWLSIRLEARHYPDVFYGVGRATTAEMEEAFTARAFQLVAQAQREVAPGSWLGLRTRVQVDEVTEVEPGRLLASGDVLGAEGGTEVGLGVVATRDTRDRAIAPRSGVLAEARWTGFTPVLGSDHRFGLLGLDARHYRPLGPGVLALRGHAEAVQGEVPFSMLPRLGGSRLLRGYRDGRFRDDLLGVLEAEYRFPVAWRFGAVVFGAVGDVAGGVDDLSTLAELERAAGAGLRFRLNHAGVNIRVDWARGREEGGLYIGLGEAF